MNKKRRAAWEKKRNPPRSGFQGVSDKTPVLSLINANTREARSAVLPRVYGSNVRKAIAKHVDMAGSILWSDDGAWYGGREWGVPRPPDREPQGG